MKKLLFFLLSVVLIGSVGCGSNKDLSTEVTNTESTEVVNETVEPTTEAVTVETEDAGTAQQESTEAVTEVDSSADTTVTAIDTIRHTLSCKFPNQRNRCLKRIKCFKFFWYNYFSTNPLFQIFTRYNRLQCITCLKEQINSSFLSFLAKGQLNSHRSPHL